MSKIAFLLVPAFGLAACSAGDGFGVARLLRKSAFDSSDSTLAPGLDVSRGAVDGLDVGHRLMAAGEYELALKAYLRAAGQNGATVDVLSAIGSANLALGRLGQAERILRTAVEAEPTFVPALNNLGVVLLEAGKLGEARATFQRAYALDSGKTDSIRENLKRAIAASEKTIYANTKAEEKETGGMSLVRRGQGNYVLLSEF